MNREALLELLPAYALGALDPDEKDAVEHLLATDERARVLLAEYEAVSQGLSLLTPVRPAPEHLQADLRKRLAATRTAEPKSVQAAPDAVSHPASRRLPWRILGLLAAVLGIVVVGVVLLTRDTDGTSTDDPAQLFATIAARNDSAWFNVVAGEVDDEVTGRLVTTSAGDEAVIEVRQLPAIDESQTFQLWLINDDGTRQSGGLFDPSQADEPLYIRVPLEKPVTAYRAIGMSLEPAGGSPMPDQPSGPRLFSIPLSS